MSRKATETPGEAPKPGAGSGPVGRERPGDLQSQRGQWPHPVPVRRQGQRWLGAETGGPRATRTRGDRGRSPGPEGGRGDGHSCQWEATAHDDTSLSRGEPGATLPGPRPPELKFEAAHSPIAHAETSQPAGKAPLGCAASPTDTALRDQVAPAPNSRFVGRGCCVRRRPEPQPQPRPPLLPPSQLAKSSEGRGARPGTERPRGRGAPPLGGPPRCSGQPRLGKSVFPLPRPSRKEVFLRGRTLH